MSTNMSEPVMESDADMLKLLSHVSISNEPSHLRFSDYAHLPLIDILHSYLQRVLASPRTGVNILVYGVPGSGKTQLAAVLANKLDCELAVIKAQGTHGVGLDAEGRIRCFRAAQSLLKQRRALILFDEAEDVFNEELASYGWRSPALENKAWMNNILETNQTPAIWVSNSVEYMNAAFIRRFDVVLETALPAGPFRQVMVERSCKELIQPEVMAQLVASPDLAPAVLERAMDVIKFTHNNFAGDASQTLTHLVESTLLAQGHGRLALPHQPGSNLQYALSALSTDRDMTRVTAGILKARAGRICLYGPSGTGKTAYGNWMARQLGRPLHTKRASDIIKPYLGETEKSLVSVFQQANKEGAVLLIDEVDSFLRDRRHAHRNWEVSAVNEMLTQMEVFEGVFIASTNLMDDIDQAALRRFDLKVKFDYLQAEQAWQLLLSICKALELSPPKPSDQQRLASLRFLTPGDFAAICRQHRFYPLEKAADIVTALANECALKDIAKTAPIGFINTAA